MSIENIKKFYEDVSKDEKLKEKIDKMKKEMNLSKESSENELVSAVVNIAEKLGYSFSKEEFKKAFSATELSDDELNINGGLSLKNIAKAFGTGVGLSLVGAAAGSIIGPLGAIAGTSIGIGIGDYMFMKEVSGDIKRNNGK